MRNTITGKTYVGVTKHANLNRRMSEHFYAAKKQIHNGSFYRSINKHGKDAFEIRPLCKYQSRAEAYSAEIDYIKNHAPEYNSTLGGGGALGHIATEKVIQTNKIIHTGNKYRAGKTHSDQTKEFLSKLGNKNIDKFMLYSSLGPKASAKKVICLDDGKSYESASEASRNYGVARSAVIELCLGKRGRKTVGGLRFQYVGGA